MKFIKFIRIFLLVLIIFGIGLLLTQNMWVPKLVNKILQTQRAPLVIKATPTSSLTTKNSITPTITIPEANKTTINSSSSNYGQLFLYIGSPDNILLTDSKGDSTGYIFSQKNIVQNIPNSSYESSGCNEDPQTGGAADCFGAELDMYALNSGIYTLKVNGKIGDYNIQVQSYSSSRNFNTSQINGTLKDNYSNDEYELIFSSDTSSVKITKI